MRIQFDMIVNVKIAPEFGSNIRFLKNFLCWLSIYSLSSQLGLQDTLIASLQWNKAHTNEGPGYDTKKSDGKVPVMLEL